MTLIDELVPLNLPWLSSSPIKLSDINDTPNGKRLASTTDWPKFQEREWPKHRQAVAQKFSGVLWR